MARKNIKRGISSAWWAILIFVPVGVVLIGIIASSNKQKLTKYSVPKDSPTYITPQFTADTIIDGVYENNKYGFRFSYPKEIFKYQDPKKTSEQEWINMDPQSSMFDSHNALYLYAKVIDNYKGAYANFENTLYENAINVPVGAKLLDEKGLELGVKLRNLSSNGIEGVYYYYKIPVGAESIKNHIYRAEWLKDNKVIAVYMLSQNKEILTKNKQLFDKLIGTLEFFTPSPKAN